jgi:uncharacterized protein
MSQANNESVQIEEPVVLIKISRLYTEDMSPFELYEATRGVWDMQAQGRKERAEYAFAVHDGLVKEVYRIAGWHPAGTTLYQARSKTDVDRPGRWEFVGAPAEESIRQKYLDRSVQHYFKGSSNPFTYVNCGA